VVDLGIRRARARHRLSFGGRLVTFALCLITLSAPALAQPPSKARVGYLASSSFVHPAFADLFLGRVSIAGGLWGGNLVLLSRSAAGNDDRLASLAAELVAARVDIILAEGTAAALAAKGATRTVPIVMAVTGDPVRTGLVADLARPGGNVTGVTSLSLELVAKRLQLIKELVPNASSVAVLWNPASPEKELEWNELRTAASRLGVTLQSLELYRPSDLAPRLDSAVTERAGALLLLEDSLTLSLAEPTGS
jgi:putative tryptophan/tyrosine transport system substrate-binding protein